jgi:hypothetical protein
MATYQADILWTRGDQDFLSNRYSRRHVIRFDGGIEVPGSSSPHVVPVPLSDPAAVDPEEAFVASIASCHMLGSCRSRPNNNTASTGTRLRRRRDGEFRRKGTSRVTLRSRFPATTLTGRAPRAPSSGARGMLHRQFGPTECCGPSLAQRGVRRNR